MEIVYTNEMIKFDSNKINGIIGDISDLKKLGFNLEEIKYKENNKVKKFINYNKNKKRMESVLNYLKIKEDILNKKMNELCSLELKKVLLMYSILNNYNILIFNYYDIGLSYKELKNFINQIKKIKQDGKQIIVISNNILFLSKIVDNITIFNNDKIIYEGNIEGLYEKKNIELPEIINFIKLANKHNAKLDYTFDNNELLKNIYRSLV